MTHKDQGQVEQASHPCAACGGSGRVPVSCDSPWHRAKLCSCNFGMDRPCPVCLGAGRIGDKMPARDAMADAETLRRFVYGATWRLSDGEQAIFRAAYWGEAALFGVGIGSARRAAQAAFQAAPGLR